MKKAMKIIIFTLIIFVPFSSISASAAIKPKIGAKCSKLNQLELVNNKVFVCAKVKTNLIWRAASAAQTTKYFSDVIAKKAAADKAIAAKVAADKAAADAAAKALADKAAAEKAAADAAAKIAADKAAAEKAAADAAAKIAADKAAAEKAAADAAAKIAAEKAAAEKAAADAKAAAAAKAAADAAAAAAAKAAADAAAKAAADAAAAAAAKAAADAAAAAAAAAAAKTIKYFSSTQTGSAYCTNLNSASSFVSGYVIIPSTDWRGLRADVYSGTFVRFASGGYASGGRQEIWTRPDFFSRWTLIAAGAWTPSVSITCSYLG